MSEIHNQLADYFDATVERITPEDVLVGARTTAQGAELRPAPQRQLRSAWAMAVAFGTTIVVISGSLGLGLLLRATSSPLGAGGTARLETTVDAPIPWIFIGGVLAALAAIGIVVGTRVVRVAGRNGGTTMTATTERPPVDDRVHRLTNQNRTLTIAVIILAILAIGLGAWAVYQATTGSDELSAPDEVMSMTDDWLAALERTDGSVTGLYVGAGYHLYGMEQYDGDQIASHLGGAEGQVGYGTHEWIAEPTLMVAGEDRWVVVRPMRITGGGESESVLSFEIITMDDGSYKIVHSVWMVDHDTVLYTQ